MSFVVPFGDADQEFHIGHASVAVPGQIHGLLEASRRLGRLPVAELIRPAVRLAREGVVLGPTMDFLHRILGEMLTHTAAAAAVFAPGGRLLGRGDRIVNPDLAETLEHLAAAGAATIRDGALAECVLGYLAPAGGLLTRADLRDYALVDRKPLRLRFRDAEVLTNPPPSAGGELIGTALRSVGDGPRASAARAHYRAVARGGFAANARRARRLGADRARPAPTGSTTHVSAVDDEGGMASLSSSNGSGSGVVVPGTGFLLNNMLGEEDLNPLGFGLRSPGERLPSMMAPTLILRRGEPYAALGSAGSNRIRSAIVQTIVSLLDGGLAVADAVRRPRVHAEGDKLDVEGGVPEHVCAALAADGHLLHRWSGRNLYFGGVNVALRERPGVLAGSGDPRRGGGVAGATRAGEVRDL